MTTSIQEFDRPFSIEDVNVFQRLTKDATGLPLSRVRDTYADGIVIDCGQLRPRLNPTKAAVVADRGEFTFASWGCDVLYFDQKIAQPIRDSGEILRRAKSAIGASISDLALNASNLSLTISFTNGDKLYFETDETNPELDQWFITFPDGASIGVTSTLKWYYRQVRV